jgi:chromosome segregation ATPase
MTRRSLSSELALLATEVDALQKALARAETELATEREHRTKAEVERDDLRQQLVLMRQRAKAAERELAKLAVQSEREHHDAEMINRELRSRLEVVGMSREQLEEALERKERERKALEQNIHELMENLRAAAVEAERASEKQS